MANTSHLSLEPIDSLGSLAMLRSTMNRLFEESVLGLARFEPIARTFPLDIRETESEYILDAALPGIAPEDEQITATDDTLAIHVRSVHTLQQGETGERTQGEKKEQGEKSDKSPAVYVRRERYIGEMSRVITLPAPIVAEEVSATYEHGILTIHAPKAAKVAPKHIPVQVSEPGTQH